MTIVGGDRMSIAIHQLERSHVPTVAGIEDRVWGEGSANTAQIISRHKVFPEGSLIAADTELGVVGYVVVQLVSKITNESWAEQTNDGFIEKTHTPNGPVVYGVNMAVLPEAAKLGIGPQFLDHIYDHIVCDLGCSDFCLGSRIPGFAASNEHDISAYVRRTRRGTRLCRDMELNFYQKCGFQPRYIIPDYFPDPESCNFGMMMSRANPCYAMTTTEERQVHHA